MSPLTRLINSDLMMQALSTSTGTPDSAKAYTNNNPTLFSPTNPTDHTTIEMTGTDRPGLFSEISAALAALHCNIVEAHAWSHNARLACVAQISDQSTDHNPRRLATIEDHLITVLRATTALSPCGKEPNNGQQEVKTIGLLGSGDHNYVHQGTMSTNIERRLHQLMLSVRDFDGPNDGHESSPRTPLGLYSEVEGRKTVVWIESCEEKGYSMVSIECKDRRKLMFDTVCTLTDMQYVIFHASASGQDGYAFQVHIHIFLISLLFCTIFTDHIVVRY